MDPSHEALRDIPFWFGFLLVQSSEAVFSRLALQATFASNWQCSAGCALAQEQVFSRFPGRCLLSIPQFLVIEKPLAVTLMHLVIHMIQSCFAHVDFCPTLHRSCVSGEGDSVDEQQGLQQLQDSQTWADQLINV